MRTLMRIGLLNLKRDRVALLLTFVLPIVFFSIFATIFSGMGGGGMKAVRIALVDEDASEASRRFVQALAADASLKVTTRPETSPELLNREQAIELVRNGELPVALIIPRGFGETVGLFTPDSTPIDLVYDEADLVAPQVVTGLMQKAAMTAAPDLMARRGIEMFEKYGGGLTPKQREAMDFFLPQLRALGTSAPATSASSPTTTEAESSGFSGPVRVAAIGVHSGNVAQERSLIAFYAAQIGVMFLLFSMAGAAGTFLEEEESGALERLLTTRLGMTRIVFAKWLYIAALGFVQVTVMFLWGWAVFKLDLFTLHHVVGFVVMATFTAAAAAAFGIVLATACRSRAQLGGVSTLVILAMSAAGGSMIPRIFMSDTMQTIGLGTFNAWALDGFQKVFWYENATDTVVDMLAGLWPQLAVLSGLTVIFLVASRLLARRWEAI
jgi:ABC-2 type transport system permease protein